MSPNNEQSTSAKNTIAADRIAVTTKSAAIRPGPVITHRNFQHGKTPPAQTVSFSSTTPSTRNIITTTIINDNITNTTATSVITSPATTTTSTTTTATTPTTNSVFQFLPVPIDMLVPKWNNNSNTVKIDVTEQQFNNRNDLKEKLKCFHYVKNKFVYFK